jgi:hypothetical protein
MHIHANTHKYIHVAHRHRAELDLLHLAVNLHRLQRENGSIILGNDSESGSFASFIREMLEVNKGRSSTQMQLK